ncbi:MAG TPA: hypothetical protein VFV38_25910 [Ktedonobacteraceae bacterium]|nr:hypothetical protein [Ktedonobacteraceae bacterium]
MLTLVLLPGLLFTMGGPLQAQAASGGQHPRKLTQAQIQALRQRLKQQIHVKHTGATRTPAGVQASRPTPLRPLDVSLPAYNNIGISDPTTRLTAGFDGSHRSYSAQALQDVGLVPGISVTSQDITFIWPSVATGQADNYQAARQIIPVNALPGAATVGFLGASAGGSSSGTATLTYTDGSTSTFTLGLTDWWTGTPAFSNVQVVQMSTINTRHGTKSGAFYLYSVTTTLNPGKTLQSVTLPSSTTGGVLHVFAVGVGGPAFNNTGISNDSTPGSANYDAGGANLSAQALAGADLVPGHQMSSDGIAYTWPSVASGAPDNYQANGQTLPVMPVPNATVLGFLGSAAGVGDSTGSATITYTDASTQTFTLGMSDWTNGTPLYGNTIVASMTYYNRSTGQQTRNIYLFSAEVALTPGKTIQSVTLPTTTTPAQIHIFAVGTRSALNNLGMSNDSQSGAGAIDRNHNSYSVQALEAAGITPGQPFAYDGTSLTLPASYGSLADNDLVTGQTQILAVTPVANATTLIVVGASDYANESGTATITYTDASTQTFTLSLSDWELGNNTQPVAFGNGIVATMTYENTPAGQGSEKAYLFSTEISLQPAKTVQSLTLPTVLSPTTGQMHIFAVGTRSAYNNTGISDDNNPAGANFDGSGNSYSEQDFQNPNVAGWNPGDTLTYQGINYIWPGVPAGQADNYAAAGQVIPVTPVAGATTIGFVGAASAGGTTGSSGTATLTYTDGTTSTFTLGLTDWLLDAGDAVPVAGNRLFAILPHYNSPQGQQVANVYLFELETRLTVGKTLQSVTLPASVNQGQLHIFMLGTRAGENYPNTIGTSDDSDTLFANYDGQGNSYSIQALEAAGLNEGQPFTCNGVTFTWPASYSVLSDNYQAAGQVIPVTPTAGATILAFLGSATNAGTTGSSGTATITYTDQSTQTFTLGFTDWAKNTLLFGNQIAATATYRNTSSGQQTGNVYVFYVSVTLQTGKTIESVTLPATVSTGQLHVFAVSTM